MLKRTLPPFLYKFLLVSILLTLVALITRLVCVYFLHLTTYPYSHYSLPHDGDGLDLMNFYIRFKHIHSREFFSPEWGSVYTYPAAVAPLYWLFYRVRHAQIPFLLSGVGLMAILMGLFARALRRHGLERRSAYWFVLGAAMFSFPFYFEFVRANMELFVWLFSACGIFFVLRDRPWLGAALLGVAAAMKLYPFVFVGLLFSKRRYGPVVFMFGVSAAVSLVSLWFICTDIGFAYRGVNEGIAYFRTHYVLVFIPVYSGMDHSLFGLMKRVMGEMLAEEYARILSRYLVLGALAGLVAYFGRIRRLPMINQVIALTVASVVLPPTSFEYTLINLYTPWALLCVLTVDVWRSGREIPGMAVTFGCFTLLLSNVSEFIFHADRLGGQIKAVTLVVLFVVALFYPLPSWIDSAAGRRSAAENLS